MDDPAAEHLQPVIFEINFKLQTRIREWKIGFHPAFLHFSKQMIHQSFHGLFQIFQNDLVIAFVFEQFDRFHLMEDWIVGAIYGVPSVHVSINTKTLDPLSQSINLVDRGMGSEHLAFSEIIRFRNLAGGMVSRDHQLIKVLFDIHNWV